MANPQAPRLVRELRLTCYAEVGIWKGDTVSKVAHAISNLGGGAIHLFDYEDAIQRVVDKESGLFRNVSFICHANTRKNKDSYNWSMMELLKPNRAGLSYRDRFDYVYLDGAHTFETDGLAFFLLDRMLRPGGYIEFDDYDWTLQGHVDKHLPELWYDEAHHFSKRFYDNFPERQLVTPHIKQVVDVLVRPSGNYEEVIENRVFRKTHTLK